MRLDDPRNAHAITLADTALNELDRIKDPQQIHNMLVKQFVGAMIWQSEFDRRKNGVKGGRR